MTTLPRRGRPRLADRPISIRIHLRLRPCEDDDLLAFFACHAPRQRATALKSALRAGRLSAVAAPAVAEDMLAEAVGDLLF